MRLADLIESMEIIEGYMPVNIFDLSTDNASCAVFSVNSKTLGYDLALDYSEMESNGFSHIASFRTVQQHLAECRVKMRIVCRSACDIEYLSVPGIGFNHQVVVKRALRHLSLEPGSIIRL